MKSICCRYGVVVVILSVLAGLLSGCKTMVENNQQAELNCRIVYTGEDGLYLKSEQELSSKPVVSGEGFCSPRFNALGDGVYYLQKKELYEYSCGSSKAELIANTVEEYATGSTGIYGIDESGIVFIHLSDTQKKVLVPKKDGLQYKHLRVSPDEAWVAYETEALDAEDLSLRGVWLLNTHTGKTKRILKAEGGSNAVGVFPRVAQWAPDSNTLVFWGIPTDSSLAIDGVSTMLYTLKDETITPLEGGCLPYPEMVAFKNFKTVVIMRGGGRQIDQNKEWAEYSMPSGKGTIVDMKGITAIAPTKGSQEDEWFFSGSVQPTRRDIYAFKQGQCIQLTNEEQYRSEWPLAVDKGRTVVFVRVDKNRTFSIWAMRSEGQGMRSFGEWRYQNPDDFRGREENGRIDWALMMDVFKGE